MLVKDLWDELVLHLLQKVADEMSLRNPVRAREKSSVYVQG